MSWHLENSISAGLRALACLGVFGGLGLYLMWVIAATIYDGTRAGSWTRVPAQIVRVDFAEVTYRYEWEGRKFEGNRAGSAVLKVASELDDWDLRMEAMVTEAQQQRKPIPILVNPANPAESMVNNEIRWALLTVFLALALGLGAGGLFGAYAYGRRALGRHRSRAFDEAAPT